MDEFTRFEHEGWERVADKYDSVWAKLTTQFISPLLTTAKISSGLTVLDVACGPGYVTAAAQQRGANVTGLDFSNVMITLAKKAHPGIEFIEGDAQNLPFENESFDRVIMNFGLLHLSHPEKGCEEAYRVLRHGGIFVFTVWAAPEISPCSRIIRDAVEAHADMNVPLPQGPPYYLFSNYDECRQRLDKIGFSDLVFETIAAAWKVPSADFLFESERNAGVRTAGLLAQQSPEVLESIRQTIRRNAEPYAGNEGYAIPISAHVISVVKT